MHGGGRAVHDVYIICMPSGSTGIRWGDGIVSIPEDGTRLSNGFLYSCLPEMANTYALSVILRVFQVYTSLAPPHPATP